MRSRGNDFEAELCGMCAIAAAKLHQNLTDAGIKCVIGVRNRKDDAHCFVIAGGFVVDVTATQFHRKPVEIVPLEEAVKHSYWRKTRIAKTPTELLKIQQRSGWPVEQQARLG